MWLAMVLGCRGVGGVRGDGGRGKGGPVMAATPWRGRWLNGAWSRIQVLNLKLFFFIYFQFTSTPVCVWSACGSFPNSSGDMHAWVEVNFCVCETARLCTNQRCLVLRDSNLASPLRWEFSNQFLCHFPSTSNGLDFFSLPSPPLQPNCNLKSVWCKYCYCWRRNQTFMRKRDPGRSRESRSRMRWQVSETAASLSTPLSF